MPEFSSSLDGRGSVQFRDGRLSRSPITSVTAHDSRLTTHETPEYQASDFTWWLCMFWIYET
jgi:hypothetical protein